MKESHQMMKLQIEVKDERKKKDSAGDFIG
jgi:hypothetical protein